MERFFKVQEVINNDLLQRSIPLFWVALINLLLWGPSLDLSGKYIPLILIFSYMVTEDYFNLEIDLWLVGIGFLFFIVCVPDLIVFLKNLSLGILIFINFFLIACKSKANNASDNCSKVKESEIELGFLPGFGLAVLVFNIIGKNEMFFRFTSKWEMMSSEMFLLISILLLICLSGRYYCMKKQVKKKEVIIEEGFGMGDVFVCAIGFAFWGGTEFFIIMFMAFLIQVSAYKYESKKIKDGLNGI